MRTLILCILCLIVCSAQAEALPEAVQALIPEGAVVEGEQSVSSFCVLTLAMESGERLELTWDTRSGAPLSLITQTAAPVSEQVQSREEAEALAQAACPGAGVLFARDGEAGEKVLCLLSETLCGEVTVSGGSIIARELTCGVYAREGRLTMEGALAALTLHRPDAEFRALELDEDDGVLYYEGEAWIDGVEYDFELEASTGKLVEWERD